MAKRKTSTIAIKEVLVAYTSTPFSAEASDMLNELLLNTVLNEKTN